jgi:UDP-N-acetylmuramyl pentapeptide synthase
MFPVSARGGVTFIRDDDKAPFWSLGSALEFMRTARATRRIVVLGTIADLGKHVRKGYQAAARESLAAAERVLFVGRQSHHALGAAPPGRSDDLLAFETVQDASRFLDAFLREGDLVLLKGSNTADHLGRLALARTSGVSCWRARCGKHRYCEACFLRHVPLGRGSGDPPAWGRRGASA